MELKKSFFLSILLFLLFYFIPNNVFSQIDSCPEPTPCTPEMLTCDFDGCVTFSFNAASSDDCDSGPSWTNPERAIDNNTLFALVTMRNTTPISECLDVTGMTGGSFPCLETVNGVEVKIRVDASANNAVNDSTVMLLLNGSPVGVDKATGTTFSTTSTTYTYGGITDLWGTSISADDILNGQLGVRFQAGWVSGVRQARVEYVEMTICGDANTGVPGQVCDSIATATDISGTVWQDINYDGAMNDGNINGVGGIDVIATDCSGNTFSTCTDENGNYIFTGLIQDTTYRVSFDLPTDCWGIQTTAGLPLGNNNTQVQFAKPGDCVNLGVIGDAEPLNILVTNCFVQGAVNSANADDVIVRWSYNNEGISTLDKTKIATKAEIGSTWGLAIDTVNALMYTTPFLKRQVGIPDHDGDGNADLDVIYSIDQNAYGTGSSSIWMDLGALGINAGVIPNDAGRGLGPTGTTFNDTDTYSQVGKVGWGDLDISEDQSTLYGVNLFDKKLYSIDIATKTINGSYIIPDSCGTTGENRPFALKAKDGKVYVGVTCDASLSQLTADLEASVFEFDPGSTNFAEILNIPLDYVKPNVLTSNHPSSAWHPWDTTSTTLPGYAYTHAVVGDVHIFEQPLLSDIEFDDNGDMTISFLDLYPHRQGWTNYKPTGTTLAAVMSGGDVLKACLNAGIFVLESNASCGGITTGPTTGGLPSPLTGPGSNAGPGGGEFYYGDGYIQSSSNRFGHGETVVGGMAVLEGSGEIAINLFDPVDDGPLNNNGVAFLNWSTGGKERGFRIATGEAKGAALGDLEVTQGANPIEIGNRVWKDLDEDGIQDACEVGIAGINVSLYIEDNSCCNANDLLVTLITDTDGYYYFNDSTIAAAIGAPLDTTGILRPNTNYVLVFGENQYTGGSFIVGGDTYELTTTDTTEAGYFNSDLIDSDVSEGSACCYNGLPHIAITTGGWGEMDYSFDMGLIYIESLDYPDYTDNCADAPCHIIRDDIYLGLGATGELSAISSATADTDVDDGVNICSSLDIVPGGSFQLPVHMYNNTANDAYLSIWVDWNGDADFNDIAETIPMTTYPVATNTGTFQGIININVPATAIQEEIAIRFRFSTDTSTNANMPCGTGTCAMDGEVEDYILEVKCKPDNCLPTSIMIRKGASN